MKRLILTLMIVFFLATSINLVVACGGKDIFFTDNPEEEAYSSRYIPKYGNMNFDAEGNLLLSKSQLKLSELQAEEMLKSFLTEKFGYYNEITREGLHYEHGSPSYMFRVELPEHPVSYHVGNSNFITKTHRYHVDSISAEIFDQGCGGGPGTVIKRFNPSDFKTEMCEVERDHHLSGHSIPSGQKSKIDGIIEKNEWDDALFVPVTIGTSEEKTTFYGCGGSGRVSSSGNTFEEIGLWLKIVDDNLAIAARIPSKNWHAILFKDFAHNGMIGDFNDAKILSPKSVQDYFLSASPNINYPIRKEGLHGCFSYSKLYKDEIDNILEEESYSNGSTSEYELIFPLSSGDVGDIDWKQGSSYMFAFLSGDSPEFNNVGKNSWISEQIIVTVSSGEESHDDEHSH